ncbi:TonB-dependent receptor [Echinicola shivajiensis]|uniref:TonB-dependent receptor n=1 Tax=Echinicola shivajiensis TaxID=1035916 RepID=UPI001BFC1AE4|nr:TonB-dependent receptor [Echinicola shivajiensis]
MKKTLHALCMIGKYYLYGFVFQLLFLNLIYAAPSKAQESLDLKKVHLSLDLNKVSLDEAFSEINKRTQFEFIYNPTLAESSSPVTLQVKNQSLENVLLELARTHRLAFKQVDNNISVKKIARNKISVSIEVDKKVTGTVVDEEGIPIPGVTIVVIGTAVGTITDIDGNYSINVPDNGKLKFSFIGFASQEVEVNNQSIIDIVLKLDLLTLNEVSIVGTSMKASDLTGAVVNVNEEKLKERPVTSINEALQGRAAGVYIQNNPQPGSDAGIRIRGNNSLQYGGNPIYVVDGIIMDRDFNMINLNDVASINVLKDASATALYGSRGANGVVVITTKKGKSGEGKVSYEGWFGVQDFVNESLTLGAKDMFELRIDALENAANVGGAYYAANPNASKDDFINDELLGPGKLWFADYEIESYNNGRNYNWLDAVTRSAMQQNHTISFSGGSDKGNYYLSFGYVDQEGLVENSAYKRYTGRINAEQNIKSWLKVGTNTTYSKSMDEFVDGKVFGVASVANPLLPISTDSLYLAWGNNWDINMENPLNSLRINKDRSKSRILTSNYININPIEGLNIRSTISMDVIDQEYYEYIPSDIQQAFRDSFRGRAIHNLDHASNYQWDNSISYEKLINNKHLINALVSTSMIKNQFKYTNVSARDFPTDDFGYYNLGAAFDKENFNLGSNLVQSTIMSYLGRLNYEYDNRYLITLTSRLDGSSKFAKGNEWGVFPSVAFAWNLANEEFMTGQSWLDQAKFRIGYGSVGNQNIPDYAYFSLYNPVYSNGNVSFNSTGLRGTTALTWEKQDQFNIGINAGVLNNRIQFTADYFNIVNSNLLVRRSLSTLTGYREAIENVGEMRNRGFEFSVDAKLIDQKELSWNVSGNISFDKNKITQLYGDVDAIYSFGGFTGTDIQREGNFFLGESINTIYMWEFDRIIQEEDMEYVNSLSLPGKTLKPGDILPKDQQAEGEEGHGVIDEDDRVIIGKKDPKFYGGFSSNIMFKNFTLNAVFTYSYGAKRVSGFYESLMSGTGYGATHKDMLDRWTPENTDTNIPRATYDNPSRFSAGETSWGIQDASYLRLATLSLAYDFPQELISKIGLSNCRVYTTGNNLLTWTKYKGYDPENGDWYPTARMFVLGLNLGF